MATPSAACAAVLIASVLAAAAVAPASAAAGRPLQCGNVRPVPDVPRDGAQLLQVHTLIRHGDRTVANANCWPHDTAVFDCTLEQLQATTINTNNASAEVVPRVYRKRYMDGREDFRGTCATGQLTSIGYNQHLTNGEALRDAYVTKARFLPENYSVENKDQFFLRSDDSSRTIKSGQALFSGLYPPTSAAGAQPVEVVDWWTMDEDTDTINPNGLICPALTSAYQEAVGVLTQSSWVNDTLVPFITNVSATLGEQISPRSVGHLADCLNVHTCHDKALPPGITGETFDMAWNLTEYEYTFVAQHNDSRYGRLGAGPLLGEIDAAMRRAVAGAAAARKLLVYAGHDTGPIMPFLVAFGVFDGTWSPYASMILLELYKTTSGSGHAVRYVYNGEVMTPPGCSSSLCDFKEWSALVDAIVPTAADCASPAAASYEASEMAATHYRRMSDARKWLV